MNYLRRSLLRLGVYGSLAAQTPTLVAKTVTGGERPIGAGLVAYLDTLLPADDVSPSASEVGVHKHLLKKAADDDLYRRLLVLGTAWLEQQASRVGAESFAALDIEARERVVKRAADSPTTTLERVFFEHTRADSFAYYYSDPATWDALGYPHAPQPSGFVEHHLAPPSSRS